MVKGINPVNELNLKGVFLQKYCVDQIQKAGWHTEEEFPVLVEYSKKAEPFESTGDIRAKFDERNLDYGLIGLVECKHRFDTRWIFVEAKDTSRGSTKMLDLLYLPESDLSRRASSKIAPFYYVNVGLHEIGNCALCNIGKEIPRFIEPDDKKHESIYIASREVAMATKSSAWEFQNDFEKYGSFVGTSYAPTHSIFVPIVVTTASIEICEYKLENFSSQKVVKDATFRKVDWLAYNFPLPSYLRTQFQTQYEIDSYEMGKQQIFFVSHTKCSEFFEALKDYFRSNCNNILREPFF